MLTEASVVMLKLVRAQLLDVWLLYQALQLSLAEWVASVALQPEMCSG